MVLKAFVPPKNIVLVVGIYSIENEIGFGKWLWLHLSMYKKPKARSQSSGLSFVRLGWQLWAILLPDIPSTFLRLLFFKPRNY